MDRSAVLAAYDEQIRRHPRADTPDGRIERDGGVIRCVTPGDGWNGVIWSDLDEYRADAVIAAQVSRFRETARPWEWKHYSHDRPADLADRLRAAGLTPEPAETLLVAELTELALDVSPPAGVELRPVTDEQGVEALVAVVDEVFGADHAALGRTLLARVSEGSGTVAAVVAVAGETPIAAGRVEFPAETDFAGLWGAGTLPAWRGRGVFRALVAHRAALAAARGYRYLQVDASDDSRPILERLGFVELATTTPFMHPGGRDTNAAMAYRVLPAADAFWRPSNQMGVLNTDVAKQLGATTLGARLWRLAPGQASTRHRHASQDELYVLLEGRGRIRVGDDLLTLDPLSALYVEADTLRQVFNDTDADALWLVVGAPPEAANTLEMTPEQLAHLYPDGPKALPPELS